MKLHQFKYLGVPLTEEKSWFEQFHYLSTLVCLVCCTVSNICPWKQVYCSLGKVKTSPKGLLAVCWLIAHSSLSTVSRCTCSSCWCWCWFRSTNNCWFLILSNELIWRGKSWWQSGRFSRPYRNSLLILTQWRRVSSIQLLPFQSKPHTS